MGVIECRSIGSCSSSGLCAGLLITGFHFQLLLTLPLTQNVSKGVSEKLPGTCAIIQIKYVLPKLCHLPQYLHGSRDPTTQVLDYTSYPVFKNQNVCRGLGGVSQDEWDPRAHLAQGTQLQGPAGLRGPTRHEIHHPALSKHLNFLS